MERIIYNWLVKNFPLDNIYYWDEVTNMVKVPLIKTEITSAIIDDIKQNYCTYSITFKNTHTNKFECEEKGWKIFNKLKKDFWLISGTGSVIIELNQGVWLASFSVDIKYCIDDICNNIKDNCDKNKKEK